MFKPPQMNQRLESLQRHLEQENPLLVDVIRSFRDLDGLSRRLGFFSREESHAIRTPWWPLISVLGLYSSGKSTFINHYLEYRLQATGNQAVDDKFTVICYSSEREHRVLPGLALDADPRFPLFQISQAIEEVAPGQGRRVDAYLQLKTCPSGKLRGKILIDSPGFDADAQRGSTLRITDHIIDLSDLVLVFFDARHPEAGSMRETLEHLVAGTIHRPDSNKFLYILNQIDATAQEDNPEEVFAAWQRALAQHGLTAGRGYSIYNDDAAVPIRDEGLRARFEAKRNADLAEIHSRIEQVSVERAYRIVGRLEQTALLIEKEIVPRLERFVNQWRRLALGLDAGVFGGLLIALLALSVWAGYWQGLRLQLPAAPWPAAWAWLKYAALAAVLLAAGAVHLRLRRWAAQRVAGRLLAEVRGSDFESNYARAFKRNSGWRRSLLMRRPAGWGKRAAGKLGRALEEASRYVQKLNDQYTNPSGGPAGARGAAQRPMPGLAAGSAEGAEGVAGQQPRPAEAAAEAPPAAAADPLSRSSGT